MSKYRVVGLESVKVGAVNTTTYAMPSTFTTILNLVPGTARIGLPVPTKQKYMVEDSDYPDIVVSEQGDQIVEFATRDMLNTFMKLGLGGTTSGTTIWKAGTTPRGVVEKSLRLVSKTYQGKKFTFDIPRAELSAGAELRLSNKTATEPGVLSFSGMVLAGQNSTGVVVPITMTLS